MNYIKTFPEVSAADVNLVGGKGANLGELTSAGFPAPPGFCLTTEAYRVFVAANQLLPEILRLGRSAQADGPEALETVSAQMRALFAAGQFPTDLAAEIQSAYAQLSTPQSALDNHQLPVAVRSSATTEDLAAASFAGQHETYLNVQGVDSLLIAVKKCWASLWTAQAISYRLRCNIEHEGVSMAVVAQVMIPADISGVLFTLDPTSGDEQTIVINASWGLGEAIVSGIVTPDRFDVSKADLKVRRQTLAIKEKMIIGSGGGTAELDVPEGKWSVASLTPDQASALAELGKRIESHYGQPQDVEWALSGGRMYVLQARPITTRPASPTPTVHWESPIPGATWARISICDSWLTDPLSPLFATTFFPALIEGWLGFVANPGLVKKVVPWALNNTINGYAYLRMDWLASRDGVSGMRALIAGAESYFVTAEKTWRNEIQPKHLERIATLNQMDLAHCSSADILRLVAETQYLSGKYWGAIGALAWYWNTGEWALSKLFAKLGLARDWNGPASYVALLQGFATKTAEAEAELYDLAQLASSDEDLRQALQAGTSKSFDDLPTASPSAQEFLRSLRVYLDKYGHQVYNLDFVNLTSSEDPSSVLLALRKHMEGQTQHPRDRLAVLDEQRESRTAQILSHLHRSPLKRWFFLKVLRWAQRYTLVRDEMTFYFTLGWPLIRKGYLELGRRLVGTGVLDREEDVFFLESKELETTLEAVSAGKEAGDWRKAVVERRALWESQKRLTPPHIVPEGARLIYVGIDCTRLMSLGRFANEVSESELRGSAVSPGRMTAPAKVILSAQDFSKLQPGDILVAPFMTPAWTPLFASASGLVTDTGGALSHGSIVAREYGIPAVMGTQAATKKIRDGQIITVDGYRGVVYLQ